MDYDTAMAIGSLAKAIEILNMGICEILVSISPDKKSANRYAHELELAMQMALTRAEFHDEDWVDDDEDEED
jgi:hypothetical protein